MWKLVFPSVWVDGLYTDCLLLVLTSSREKRDFCFRLFAMPDGTGFRLWGSGLSVWQVKSNARDASAKVRFSVFLRVRGSS